MNQYFAQRSWVLVSVMGMLVVAGAACSDDVDAIVDGGVYRYDGGATDGFAGPDSAAVLDGAVDVGTGAEVAVESSLSDPQIVGVLIEANNGEVGEGEVADVRAVDSRVAAFGRRMVLEHNAANTRVRNLSASAAIMPVDSGVRRALAAQATAQINSLWAQPVGSFDRTYVQSQITAHMQVLNLIDTVLVPSVTNTQLRTELTTLRAAVVAHWSDAQTLLAQLQGDAGVPADAAMTGADAGRDGATEAGVSPDGGATDGPVADATTD